MTAGAATIGVGLLGNGPFTLGARMTRVEALHAEMPPSSASCKPWKRSKPICGGNMPNSPLPRLADLSVTGLQQLDGDMPK
jgi:hypothetical protein